MIDGKFEKLPNTAELFAIGVGGTAARKHWPSKYYIELIKLLLQENENRRFLIIGGQEDANEAHDILETVGNLYVVDFTAGLNFRMSATVIGNCNWYIGNDTSTMHLAAAQGIPVLSPNCYPYSLGLGENAVPVIFAPRNVPAVIALPKEAMPECRQSLDNYGCKMKNSVHCIRAVKPKLMFHGFHMLRDMKKRNVNETKYIVDVIDEKND